MEAPNLNSPNRIKPIGIEDFTRLVKDRLEYPEAYNGRTLILWNGSYNPDGIAYQVIEQCCIDYNRLNPDSKIWFRNSDTMFLDDDYTKPALCRQKEMWGFKPGRLIFNTGCFMRDKLCNRIDDWFHFVNTHENNRGHIPADCPLIACALADLYNFKEDRLSDNCDIYSLQPSVEEWGQWAAPYFNDSKAFQPLLAFLTQRGNVTNYCYHFGSIEKPFTQTDFLFIGRIIKQLDREMEIKYSHLHSIKDIPQEDRHKAIAIGIPGLSGFPVDEFWEFIQNGEW